LVALYVTSSERAVGKTALCAGLGKYLLNDGKKVGFLKPLIADGKPKEGADSDAVFMKRIFALEEPVDYLCPVISGQNNLTNSIKEAYAKVSQGKDVVIVEGGGLDKASTIAEALGAKVIIIESYPDESPKAKLIDGYKDFVGYLLGVVVNKVPRARLERVSEEMSARYGKAGINILGILPEDRALFTLTVAELAQHIQGEILNQAEKSEELVENFMLGAKCVDPGPQYFSRKTNKAVIVRSERPDMQMAALETPTRCLILSGDTLPTPAVLYQAEVKKVPVILAKADIISIVTSIEDALGKTRFNQEKKLPELIQIMKRCFDFQALYRGLGLETR
jgi:hypothetical protein